MPVSANTLRKLIEAGLSGDELVSVVEAIDADMDAMRPAVDDAAERRRAKDRERKRQQRDGVRGNVCGNSAEKEKPPHTPQKKTTSPSKNPPKGGQKGSPSYSDSFETFWAEYPRKAGTSKTKAAEIFERLGPDGQAAAIGALPAFQKSVSDTEPEFIPHAATWLNQRRFETYDCLPNGPNWRGELILFRDYGDWRPDGPEPGKPGCKAPPELLAEFGYAERAA
jgi:hypothetical protein